MKLTTYLYMAAATLALTACGNTSNNDNQQDSIWIAPTVSNEIIDMQAIEHTDTFSIHGKKYTYDFRLAPVDSLPVVMNADGSRYHDNDVTLTVRRDSTGKMEEESLAVENFRESCRTLPSSVSVSTSPMPTTTPTCASSPPWAIPTRLPTSSTPSKSVWLPTVHIPSILPKTLRQSRPTKG